MRKETPIEKSDIKAFLGPGSQFEGKLVFNEIVRLDGAFRGEVTSHDTLIVGESAEIQADIQVGTLILSGNFKGNVKAKTRVELRSPAKVDGTIETPAISVEDGVLLNGTITMNIGENAAGSKAVEVDAKK
ncbi:MAG: polymer-forming cytoskeletal protein [Desulfuromonadales bacterium]|nr:polymer-forming cytoskeletal protein [Desulfuromonadales bacterium]MDH3807738.1 polymer-forming cytoskeletal protein [Desulfuromonadales bacterium]MDH3869376.1 polymer-forming cytoskeletal protein [Desulfuromonadales bacterium]MDH4024173.1 polymer-forming cytoskeletal protein [Desulfuromonadales bacterium]